MSKEQFISIGLVVFVSACAICASGAFPPVSNIVAAIALLIVMLCFIATGGL